jgi:hypothetical protein
MKVEQNGEFSSEGLEVDGASSESSLEEGAGRTFGTRVFGRFVFPPMA